MGPMYGVASETSTVARSRSRDPRNGIGRRRIGKVPGPLAHALDAVGLTTCGVDASDLIPWPGLEFDEVDRSVRCPRCHALVG